MSGEDGYFDESVAATYDDPSDKMFAPEVLGPTVGPTTAGSNILSEGSSYVAATGSPK